MRINILTKECDFEIANLNNTKIPSTGVNKCYIFDNDQTQVYLFLW